MNNIRAFVDNNLAAGKKPNRLINEKSPYLLQHAFNPVEWYPWGEEAFQKARSEDKPIFLSIGYSTCYWCHVMEREVFENELIAALMNDTLVCIKVDREERPDVDRIYMTAVQAMTGSGGWPMSVFLTQDLKPFFGATYIPPKPQWGRPGFPELVNRISHVWHTDRDSLIGSGEKIAEFLRQTASVPAGRAPDETILHQSFAAFSRAYDHLHAGFGSAPKFPRPCVLTFLLRYHARTGDESALSMALETLRNMAAGGVHDQIGGGFHRYSVDGEWRVPHFEKMLYDQAQLAIAYLEAYQVTHDILFETTARSILGYVLGNLTSSEGGFYSAEDAESAFDHEHPEEKEEGVFYLWTKSEIGRLLGERNSPIVCTRYGIRDSGNALHDPTGMFRGNNILYRAATMESIAAEFGLPADSVRGILDEARDLLLHERGKRPRPHLDDKILTAWNGLMISGFARAYQVLGDDRFLQAAVAAADCIERNLRHIGTGRLLRRYRDGSAGINGGLQDYAFFVAGLIDLYEAAGDIRHLNLAVDLTEHQIDLFRDREGGGFFDTAGDDSSILVRTKEDYDGAEPSGNSVACLNLLRLARMTGREPWLTLAGQTIRAFGSRMEVSPEALPLMASAIDLERSVPVEIVIAGDPTDHDTRAMMKEIRKVFLPHAVYLFADGGEGQRILAGRMPFIAGMKSLAGKPTAYICEDHACKQPANNSEEVQAILTDIIIKRRKAI